MEDFSGLLSRFIRYTEFDTESDAGLAGTKRPTTDGQIELLQHLEKELQDLGLETYLGSEAVVMGTLKGNVPGDPIGFMAHVDTASDVKGNGVKAVVHECYDGSDITLGDTVISPSDSPDLLLYKGGTIITSSGDTLLGADDKAGVAVIMEALSYLVAHPEIPHRDIEVFFTPDEETGSGMDSFPYDRIRSRICYTVDGGREGEVESECFNAATLTVHFTGSATHLGSARGKLKNALVAASSFVAMLPRSESPEATDGRYGYYAVMSIHGSLEEADVEVFIRDFESDGFERRIAAVKSAAETVSLMFQLPVECRVSVSYRNMAEANAANPRAMEALFSAAQSIGMELEISPIRGGTDGARLAEHGVSCPNIFTGGHDFHSKKEWIALEAMERSVRFIIATIKELAK